MNARKEDVWRLNNDQIVDPVLGGHLATDPRIQRTRATLRKRQDRARARCELSRGLNTRTGATVRWHRSLYSCDYWLRTFPYGSIDSTVRFSFMTSARISQTSPQAPHVTRVRMRCNVWFTLLPVTTIA